MQGVLCFNTSNLENAICIFKLYSPDSNEKNSFGYYHTLLAFTELFQSQIANTVRINSSVSETGLGYVLFLDGY